MRDRVLRTIFTSAETLLQVWNDEFTNQIKIRHGERCKGAGRVLHQPAISNLRKAPEPLHDSEGVFTTSSRPRTASIDFALMIGQRMMEVPPPVHPIPHPGGSKSLPICLFPVRLIAEDLTLLAVQQHVHLRDVCSRRMPGRQPVHHAPPVGSHMY